MVKNCYPLPRINYIFDRLRGEGTVSKIALHSGYHQLWIKEEDIPYGAFRTQYRHYEFVVTPVRLTNTLAALIDLINQVFKPYLGQLVVVFVDDVLIYSRTQEEYSHHLRTILEVLWENELYAKLKKCEF